MTAIETMKYLLDKAESETPEGHQLVSVNIPVDIIREIVSTAQQWIPFKTRPLTEEEKEEYPEWNCILDCKLPDDGQAILVSINRRGHERVQYDEFYSDDGSYLDSGYAIGEEATAWMPLPEPWRGEEHEPTMEEFMYGQDMGNPEDGSL